MLPKPVLGFLFVGCWNANLAQNWAQITCPFLQHFDDDDDGFLAIILNLGRPIVQV